MSISLDVFNPVADSSRFEITPPPRVADIEGKTIGLYWNLKPGGDVALKHVAEILGKKYPTASFHFYQGSVGAGVKRLSPAEADQIAAECDIAVGSTGDCGSCCSWLIRDMIELEKRGLPAVGILAKNFEEDGLHSAELFGMPEVPFIVVPEELTSRTADAIRAMVEDQFVDLQHKILAVPTRRHAQAPKATEEWLTFEATDRWQAIQQMNENFLERQWSDGLFLLPATHEAVEEMLTGTKRDPEEVDALLEPGDGIATVRKIAANAVMAGCRPEHLRVVISAVECISDPRFGLRSKAVSTGPDAPLIIVNGPIRQEIGINSGQCALGPGSQSHVNTVIGRALRLCMMNVGHTYPGISDMDTIGSPSKYSMCIGENEEASPWQSYAVDQGLDADANSVTVGFIYGHADFHDLRNTDANKIIDGMSTAATYLGILSTGNWLKGRRADPRHGTTEQDHDMVLLTPERAQIFADQGWGKQEIKRALFKKARATFESLMDRSTPEAFAQPTMAWLWESPETMVPVMEDPDCFDVIVVGSGMARDIFCWGKGGPVTKPLSD